jgi:hypothetical protein
MITHLNTKNVVAAANQGLILQKMKKQQEDAQSKISAFNELAE